MRRAVALATLASAAATIAPASTPAPVAYRAALRGSTLSVEIVIPEDARKERARLVVPRAIPMGYGQQPYDAFVRNATGSSDGGEVAFTREDGPRFLFVARSGGTISSVRYEVDIARMEQDVTSGGDVSRVREKFAFILGYSVFGFIEGLEERRVVLEFSVDGSAQPWPVVSTLASSDAPGRARVSAEAANFYALADSQILAGPGFTWRRLRADFPLFLAVYSESARTGASDVVAPLAEESAQALVAYFGSRPFEKFTLIFQYLRPLGPRHTYGFSMEHLETATFGLVADAAPHAGTTSRDLRLARYNIAHHVAHAWIPKRSYGEGYFPFQWEVAPLIDTVWFSEGFAQYAAADALDAITPAEGGVSYRDSVVAARFRTPLAAMPAFLREMPLLDLSRVASQRYSEDFRIGRTTFARGGLMADAMDRRIRERTSGAKSLRDAFRHFVAWTARERRAFRLDEIPALIRESTGVDVRDLFDRGLAPMR